MITKRDNALLAFKHQQPEYIPFFFSECSLFMACPELERYTGLDRGTDAFGVEWIFDKHNLAPFPNEEKYVLEDITEWKEVIQFPDLEAIDWEKQAEKDMTTDFGAYSAGFGIIPFADGHSIKDVDSLKSCMVLCGMFERLHALMGMEEALMALVAEPEACYEFFGALADWKIEHMKKVAKYYPVDVINAHDDYGTASGLFMSPETWRTLIKPHLKRIVDACHELGMFYQHHSCGVVAPLLDDLVEIGIDAIDPMQPCNGDLKELKEKYGSRLTFCGGFDNINVLDNPDATDEDIKAEYRRTTDILAPGGSFICYPVTITSRFFQPFVEEHFAYGMSFYANQK